MVNKGEFAAMRKEIEQFDKLREQLIQLSREVLKVSKKAIYSTHRNEISEANKQLKSARATISSMDKLRKKDAHLLSVGAYNEALEEYVEASCYMGFITKNQIPTAKELNVDTYLYLQGLCDMVGELVRKAINSSIQGDYETAKKIRKMVAELHAELMLFDFRNIPVRRKFDAIKYGLDKLEDLMLQIEMKAK